MLRTREAGGSLGWETCMPKLNAATKIETNTKPLALVKPKDKAEEGLEYHLGLLLTDQSELAARMTLRAARECFHGGNTVIITDAKGKSTTTELPPTLDSLAPFVERVEATTGLSRATVYNHLKWIQDCEQLLSNTAIINALRDNNRLANRLDLIKRLADLPVESVQKVLVAASDKSRSSMEAVEKQVDKLVPTIEEEEKKAGKTPPVRKGAKKGSKRAAKKVAKKVVRTTKPLQWKLQTERAKRVKVGNLTLRLTASAECSITVEVVP